MYLLPRLRSTRPLACLVACAVSCHPTERNTHALIHLAFVFRSSPHLRLLLFSSSVCCFGYHSPCAKIKNLHPSTSPQRHHRLALFFCFLFPCSSASFFPVHIAHPPPPPSPLTPSGCHVPCGRVTYSCDPLLDT
ncbi:hypothetical protein IWZ03DRAFT_32665 [Phyllosticta citriasiana]|uniref:Secreted protein n=1 Tax=Phyllosticta citriasiana TaxID=595635 RepID=A0ABR1L5F2_9PEZI